MKYVQIPLDQAMLIHVLATRACEKLTFDEDDAPFLDSTDLLGDAIRREERAEEEGR